MQTRPETQLRVCITVENSPSSPNVCMGLCKHGKMSSIAFIKYFSKIIQQIKENAAYCSFFNFLIETDFLDTCSYFLPANQNGHLTTHNESKFV